MVQKILDRIAKEKNGMSFTAFLTWASEQNIDNADVVASRMVADGKLRIDYPQGVYLSV